MVQIYNAKLLPHPTLKISSYGAMELWGSQVANQLAYRVKSTITYWDINEDTFGNDLQYPNNQKVYTTQTHRHTRTHKPRSIIVVNCLCIDRDPPRRLFTSLLIPVHKWPWIDMDVESIKMSMKVVGLKYYKRII